MTPVQPLDRQVADLRARLAEVEREMEVRAPLAPAERLAGILQLVAVEVGLPPELIRGECRQRELVQARWLVMALAQRCLGYSLPRIGRLLGRDHTTVHHGVHRIAALAEADPALAARIEALAARLTNPEPRSVS